MLSLMLQWMRFLLFYRLCRGSTPKSYIAVAASSHAVANVDENEFLFRSSEDSVSEYEMDEVNFFAQASSFTHNSPSDSLVESAALCVKQGKALLFFASIPLLEGDSHPYDLDSSLVASKKLYLNVDSIFPLDDITDFLLFQFPLIPFGKGALHSLLLALASYFALQLLFCW